MVDAYDRGALRPVCAACNRPADEGSCPTCRGYRTGPPEGGGPSGSVLLAVAAGLLALWVVLLLVG
ncbi:hypothetical protein CLV35_2939 [Motilibacter peucedani]|uniref:Uncharacterized protein n=1 Tax=Motilibacter peucedani TaxID=598650 RepID=A0A420XN30_9ACTN|nr:hypothetical protein [Motilibacter peucedani]RKS72690.1 hypothetical protein CLV35_2939 [Motilibacter peucedani]